MATTKTKKQTKKKPAIKAKATKKPRKKKGEVVVVKKNKDGKEIKGFVRELDNGNYIVDKGHKYFLYEQGMNGGNASFYFEEEKVMNAIQEFLEQPRVFESIEPRMFQNQIINVPIVERRIISIDELCEFMGITSLKLREWRRISDELNTSCEMIKLKEKNKLVSGALYGEVKENVARFLLTVNHKMVDKSEVDNTFKMVKATINIPSSDPLLIEAEENDE